jgi:hypothetical protein
MSLKNKAQKVWQHYESRKRLDDFEPAWTHRAYEMVRQFIDGTLHHELKESVTNIITSHDLADGTIIRCPPFNRVMHDGWKVGTPTWIFMGRQDAEPQRIANGWILLSRQLPDRIAAMFRMPSGTREWMAFHPELPMGYTAMTSNVIGPCHTAEEIRIYAMAPESRVA